jgi:hypothetical protein
MAEIRNAQFVYRKPQERRHSGDEVVDGRDDTVKPFLNGISMVQNIFPGFRLIKVYYDSNET